jgi:hypothetical protein
VYFILVTHAFLSSQVQVQYVACILAVPPQGPGLSISSPQLGSECRDNPAKSLQGPKTFLMIDCMHYLAPIGMYWGVFEAEITCRDLVPLQVIIIVGKLCLPDKILLYVPVHLSLQDYILVGCPFIVSPPRSQYKSLNIIF